MFIADVSRAGLPLISVVLWPQATDGVCGGDCARAVVHTEQLIHDLEALGVSPWSARGVLVPTGAADWEHPDPAGAERLGRWFAARWREAAG